MWLLLLSCPVVSDSFQPHEQHSRSPCPSPAPGVCPSLYSLHRWCHVANSSSDTLFSFCPQASQHHFSNELAACIRWPKYWNFSFSISPSNEYSWLISFKIDWFDLLAVQATLRSLLQYHSSKPSVLCALPSLQSSSHNYTWPLGRP